MIVFPTKKEILIEGRTGNLFGHHSYMRLAAISAFLAKESPKDTYKYDRLSPTQFLQSMISCLQTVRLGVAKVATPKLWRIDVLLQENSSLTFRTDKWRLRKPKVTIDFEINRRGGLSLLWHPDPKDFAIEDMPFHPSYSGRPLNEFLYFQEFEDFADAMHSQRLEEWERAMIGHLVFTFKGIIEEIIKEVGDYCEVKVGNRLEVVRGQRGRITGWEIVHQNELDARKRALARSEKERELHRVCEKLDDVLVKRGLTSTDMLGRVDELRAGKKTYAVIEKTLVTNGLMYALEPHETLKAIVTDIRRLVERRGVLTEELNGLP
jgi:hypothetical protein